MDKIKNVLHKSRKSEDVTRDSHDGSASQPHPIYDEMTGQPHDTHDTQDTHDTHHGKYGKERTLTAAGGPYAQVQTTSGEPYTTLAQPGAEGLKAEHIAADPTLPSPTTTSGHVGDSKTTSGHHHGSPHATAGDHVTSSTTTHEPHGTSHTTTGATSGHHFGSSHATTGEHVPSSTTAHEPHSTSHATTGGILGSSKTTSHEPHSSHTTTGGILDSSTTTSREPHASHTTTGGILGSSNTTSHEPHASHTPHTTSGYTGDSSIASGAALGAATATTGAHLRPAASPTGKDSVNTGVSGASIKSGVIGFGPSETQGHAALPTQHAAEKSLGKDQVVGGGDYKTGETATRDSHPTTESQTLPHSTTTHTPHDTSVLGTGTQQPVRQESYTADTDRSFPLAGGVASKHADDSTHHHTATAAHAPSATTGNVSGHDGHSRDDPTLLAGGVASKHKENAPIHHETSTVEKEHATKEKEKDGHRSIPIVGGLLAKITSKDKDKDKEHTSTHHTSTSERQPGTVEKESHLGHAERSAPLVAGVASKHSETTPTHHQTSAIGGEPATVEKGSHIGGTEHSVPVVAGVASKHSDTTPTHHQTSTIGGDHATVEKGSHLGQTERSAPVVAGVTPKHSETTPTHHQTSALGREPAPTGGETYNAGHDPSAPLVGGALAGGALAGGLASKHSDSTPTHHHTSTTERDSIAASHTTDTDRSLPIVAPLVGSVGSKHSEPTTTQHQTATSERVPAVDSHTADTNRSVAPIGVVPATIPEHTTTQSHAQPHTTRNEREATTKGSDPAHTQSSIPIIGGLLSKFSSKDKDKSPEHVTTASEREPIARESDTTKTHHSTPVVGGLVSKSTPKEKEPEHASTHHHTTTTEREPVAKEGDTAKTHHSIPIVGGLMSKFTSKDKEPEHASTQHHTTTSEREPGTKDRDVAAHDGHGREALAGAAAAAAATGTAGSLSHSDARHGTDGTLSSTTPQTTTTTTDPHPHTAAGPLGAGTTSKTESTQHQPHPEALAAATAAAAAAASRSSTTHEPGHGTSTGPAVASKSAPVGEESIPRRPAAQIRDSYRHVPGGFPGTPGDESKTFLDYRPVVGDAPATSTSGPISETTPGLASTGTTSGQHELRHTGSLEQPAPKSSDIPSEHHHGRDAAIAGGVVAGAAGLGHAASEKRETTDTSSKPLYEGSSPYSSKTLDPRVLGTGNTLGEQRFDPQARTATHTQDATHTSNPVDISTLTGPTTSHSTAGATDSHHHLGRDAALVGAGATTASAARPTAPRNDTEGMGTFVLPPTSSERAPVSSSTAPTSHQTTTGGDTFYGTAGAPAPRTETTSAATTSASHVPEKQSEHHVGRDATLAGAGLATAGGLHAAGHDNKTETGPASKTIGSHDNNTATIADSKVHSDSSKHKDESAPVHHKSSILNKLDPRVKATETSSEKAREKEDHHYGRDAAVAGGTGAAAYEAAKKYDEHRSTQPEASMTEQRYDTTAAGAHAPNPVSTKAHHDPSTSSNVDRNTALAGGAGLGAATAGTAAYVGSKHGDNTRDLPLHQKQNITGQPGSVTQSGPTHGTIAPQSTHAQDPLGHQRYDSIIDPSKQQHDKRDAALLGTAGAATAGGAAYGLSQHQETEREREHLEKEQEKQRIREAHEREKEQHKAEKEQHKQEKEANKLQKEQHKHDKAVVAAEHKHEKEAAAQEKEQHRLEKEQHKREKEEEKQARRLSKEEDKEARRLSKVEEGEKKGGIFGFLHRDKSKKEKASPEGSPRASKEYAAAGTAGAIGAGTAAATHDDENDPNSPRWKAKNVLHKEPPLGHPARESLDRSGADHGEGFVGKREHVGVDGPIGHPDLISGDRETRKGVFGAHEIGDHQSKPVVDPITGLTMDVGKYGPSTGGTDGYSAIAKHNILGTDSNTPTTGHGHVLGTDTNTSTTGHTHVPGTTSGTTGTGIGTGVGTGTSHTHPSTARDVV